MDFKKINVYWLCVLFVLVNIRTSPAQQINKSEFLQIRDLLIETKHYQHLHSGFQKHSTATVAQNSYDVTYYKLNLNIDPDAQLISGFVEIKGIANTDAFTQIELDLFSNMVVDSIGYGVSGFSHQDNKLIVTLSQSINFGESFSISIFYHGAPQTSGFGSFQFGTQGGKPVIWSLSEPYFARTWWPCKDTPIDKADSVDMVLTVPEDLTAVSNGRLMGNKDNGDGTRTFSWRENYPIATYLVSVAITNYDILSGQFEYSPGNSMEVDIYVYPEFLDDGTTALPQAIDMLGYFHQVFGPYPFLMEKYGIAQFSWGGGMEHQTVASQGSFNEVLTVHELAHQWWGDKITIKSWQDIWLNEGFASYAEALYFEHKNGNPYYHEYMSFMDKDFPVPIFVADTTSVQKIFNYTVYDKGAWFLHMLRHVVGDNAFFDILLEFSQKPDFSYGNVSTNDFLKVCEEVSGSELDWFFEPWIYHTGRPVYSIEWWPIESSGENFLRIKIEQTQVPQQVFFPMLIDITIQTIAGDTTVQVFNDSASQVFTIKLLNAPTGILVDPDNWILKRIDKINNVYENSSIPSSLILKQNYPNPVKLSSENSDIFGTTIEFFLLDAARTHVEIYNIQGQKIKTLVDEELPPGTQKVIWDGTNRSEVRVPSGVYLFRLKAGNAEELKKMIVLQ